MQIKELKRNRPLLNNQKIFFKKRAKFVDFALFFAFFSILQLVTIQVCRKLKLISDFELSGN